jgi:MFS family permease
MQSVAQAWLVLQLTNSPFYLGLDGFANTLPIALFSLWGGVVADRFDRRRLLIWTQWIMLGLALVLAILSQAHLVTVWLVIGFSFCTGLTQAIAWPVYQAVLANIVRREHMSNAIALNSTQFNVARMIGPVLGAAALSTVGTAGCFYANAVSFLAVIYALTRVQQVTNRKPPGFEETSLLQSMREGLGYVAKDSRLKWILVTMAVSTLLGVPLVTLLPVFARDILHVGAAGYGILVGAFGAGAVSAGVLVALLGDFHGKGLFVVRSIVLFVLGMLGFALSRNMLISVICLLVTGFSMVGYASVINTMIQKTVPDHLRGRAMSLFVFSFGGCMPFGNLLAGYFAKVFSAPTALLGQGFVLGLFSVYLYCFHPEIREHA